MSCYVICEESAMGFNHYMMCNLNPWVLHLNPNHDLLIKYKFQMLKKNAP